MNERAKPPEKPLLSYRLLFEHDSRPYVWTGLARTADAAEAEARSELFGVHPFAAKGRPRLVQMESGTRMTVPR